MALSSICYGKSFIHSEESHVTFPMVSNVNPSSVISGEEDQTRATQKYSEKEVSMQQLFSFETSLNIIICSASKKRKQSIINLQIEKFENLLPACTSIENINFRYEEPHVDWSFKDCFWIGVIFPYKY